MAASEPMDIDTARRVLARVPHAQRFTVGRFVPPVGLLGSSVRGLEELQLALRPEDRSLPGVNMKRLADWIETDVGDPAGAARVRDAVRTAPSYIESCIAVHELLVERLDAARKAVGSGPWTSTHPAVSTGRE